MYSKKNPSRARRACGTKPHVTGTGTVFSIKRTHGPSATQHHTFRLAPLASPLAFSVRAALQARPAWLRIRGLAGRNRGAPAVSETLRMQRATCRSLSGLAASVVLYRLPV
eukprot:scaffold16669_cov129-Isochrysis_galbana.AAC.2